MRAGHLPRRASPSDRFGHLDCDICGKRLRSADAAAEMYDRSRNHKSVVCHFECGLAEGLDIA